MLKRQKLNVYLENPDNPETGEPLHFVVLKRGADEMRAEAEGKGLGIKPTDGIHMVYLIAWAALNRTGQWSGPWDRFRKAVIDVNSEDLEAEPVDPTQQAASTGPA